MSYFALDEASRPAPAASRAWQLLNLRKGYSQRDRRSFSDKEGSNSDSGRVEAGNSDEDSPPPSTGEEDEKRKLRRDDDRDDGGRGSKGGRPSVSRDLDENAESCQDSEVSDSDQAPPHHGAGRQSKNAGWPFLAAFFLCLVLLFGILLYEYRGVLFDSGSSATSTSSTPVRSPTTSVTGSGSVSTAVPTSAFPHAASNSSGSASLSTSAPATSAGLVANLNTEFSALDVQFKLPGVSKNNIGIGFFPDEDHSKTIAELTTGLGIKTSFYGRYAQLNSVPWDGAQLTQVLSDAVAAGAIFQPAVMPTSGWTGLTESDNSQALAIAQVLKQFTDKGLEVWLRFAHEVNWYQQDGTYKGTADDFKTAWSVVAKAVADNNKIKMFFTPNVADLATYQRFYPTDPTTVDVIGIGMELPTEGPGLFANFKSTDYYPKSAGDWISVMQPFYDAYCKTTGNHTTYFAVGETGLGWVSTIEERLDWLDQMTSAQTAAKMPLMVGATWFNFDKEEDFRLWNADDPSISDVSKAWFANGTVPSGAVVPV